MHLGRKALFALGFYEPVRAGVGLLAGVHRCVDERPLAGLWLACGAPQQPSCRCCSRR